jgi:hypothetical protein
MDIYIHDFQILEKSNNQPKNSWFFYRFFHENHMFMK